MKSFLCLLILITAFLAGCKKDKSTTYSGQLLLCKKFPYPVSNKRIEMYQSGSPSIPINIGSTSASANTITDAGGSFRMDFTPGKASFLIFSGSSSSPITLSSSLGDTAFPVFTRRNFTGEPQPAFIGKVIDTVVLKVNAYSALAATDTIGAETSTVSGKWRKAYTGESAAVGTTFIIDTLYNVLITDFDCSTKMVRNTIYAGRLVANSYGNTYISTDGISPYEFSVDDEVKKEIVFYFRK